jgi:hypothetical protein
MFGSFAKIDRKGKGKVTVENFFESCSSGCSTKKKVKREDGLDRRLNSRTGINGSSSSQYVREEDTIFLSESESFEQNKNFVYFFLLLLVFSGYFF